MNQKSSRRAFVRDTTVGISITTLAEQVIAQTTSSSTTGVPTRELGKTGQRVSIVCLGGAHLGAGIKDEKEATQLAHTAIDEGVNFFDNAWCYFNGAAEERLGRILAIGNRRSKAFLMTKNCERDYQGSMKCLEDSLRRLQTDYLDLWQFHEVVYDNDPDWIFEKGGLKAALEARKAGKVRFIGFTGHKDPRIHLKMLSKPFDWDTAQMPINVMDAFYRSFQNEVVPVCLKKRVGVLGMKGQAGGSFAGYLSSKVGLSALECYRYCLSLPISAQVMGIISMEQLRQVIAMVRDFKPMSDSEKNALLSRVKDEATDGRHERFKTTQMYDSSHHRKQHGFELTD